MITSSRRDFLKTSFYSLVAALPAAFQIFASPNDPLKSVSKSSFSRKPKVDAKFEPRYLKLHRTGELKKRGEILWEMMSGCRLCPRECGVNRLQGEEGFCQSSSKLEIASFHPHHGEERPLVGLNGSGTIFFTNCGLRCVFCINWEISQEGEGEVKSLKNFAEMMLLLQKMGCHNINIVTPTHYSPHILLGLDIAAAKGLRLPLVYNTCGWERYEVLKILDGVVDIYLPDFKYSSNSMADKFSSGADSYVEVTQTALLEMHRQVGIAKPGPDGLMYSGLMIRHLVMPNKVAGSKLVIKWIAENLPLKSYLNIMSQYQPMYKAFDYPEIARRLKREEYQSIVRYARELGMTNLNIQGYYH